MCDLETSRIGVPYIYDISSRRVKTGSTRGVLQCTGRSSVQDVSFVRPLRSADDELQYRCMVIHEHGNVRCLILKSANIS